MKIKITLFFICAVAFYSCGSNERYKTATNRSDSPNENRFVNIHLASKYDTSCGMPLSAGLEDTLHYNNKVYGFCSQGCKEEFITKLKKNNKR